MHINVGPITTGSSGQIFNVKLGDPILFLDNDFLSHVEAIERIWHLPEKRPEPVMKATKPWEIFGKYKCVGGFSGKSFVVKDDKIMMFYSIYHMGPGPEFRSFAYAESKNGLKWTKPDINKGTNLLVSNKGHASGFGPAFPYWEMQNVLYDERSGLYRAMGHCKFSDKKYGTFYASSKDPTKWDTKTFRYAYKNADIHALLGWDAPSGSYVSYPRVPVWREAERRAIGISQSRDFEKWHDPILCHQALSNDPVNYEIYNMPVERIGPQVVAFPIGYRSTPGGIGPLDTEFAFSYGGASFFQPMGHNAWIPRGLPGEWDDCYVMAAAPIVFKGQTLIYYWGCNFPHDTGFREEIVNEGSVGLAVLPENRYCGLSCPRHYRGVVETEWLSAAGAKVFGVNANVRGGKINITWSDKDGEGNPVGEIRHLDITNCKMMFPKVSERFKLRFEISDAELFGFKLT